MKIVLIALAWFLSISISAGLGFVLGSVMTTGSIEDERTHKYIEDMNKEKE